VQNEKVENLETVAGRRVPRNDQHCLCVIRPDLERDIRSGYETLQDNLEGTAVMMEILSWVPAMLVGALVYGTARMERPKTSKRQAKLKRRRR
jgi:hypothetical protein